MTHTQNHNDDAELREKLVTYRYKRSIAVKHESWRRVDALDNGLLELFHQYARAEVEAARSKDPHVCEFGHEVYSHKTADGWCCACEADQAWLNAEIERRVEQATINSNGAPAH